MITKIFKKTIDKLQKFSYIRLVKKRKGFSMYQNYYYPRTVANREPEDVVGLKSEGKSEISRRWHKEIKETINDYNWELGDVFDSHYPKKKSCNDFHDPLVPRSLLQYRKSPSVGKIIKSACQEEKQDYCEDKADRSGYCYSKVEG